MEDDDITGGSFEVTNVIGAGGSVAMTRLMNAEGDEHTMMTAGLGVVGSLYSFGARYKLDDATPLAQLIEDQEGVLVPADSPFKTIDDLVAAWEKDPDSVVIGGGSSPGGPDHLFPMQLATAVGVDPRELRYVVYDGGGPLTTALLGNKIDVGFSGVGEFEGPLEAGELRALAVSGEERLKGEAVNDVPTLTEAGIDLVFTNWRGVFAPPGISDERRDELIAMPRGDARHPRVEASPRGQRLDRRVQDRRRVHDVPGGAGRAGRRPPSRSWTCCEHTPTTRPRRRERHAARPRPRRSSASPRCSSSSAPSPSATPPRSRRLRRPGRSARLPLRHRRRLPCCSACSW